MADETKETEEQSYERRWFIRETAMRVYIQGMVAGTHHAVTFSPQTCWKAAVALWDAKPEDC